MKTVFKSTLLLVLLIVCKPIPAEVEIGGLLLDNTVSRFGREFYYQFSQLWPDIPHTQGINVAIKEQVVPRAGTRLTVHMNNQIIYVTYMGRRQSPMEERVEQAIMALLQAMARSRLDNGSEDMAANGW